jgi:hypothetical protein
MIENLVIGAIGSLIASAFFIIILYQFRPNLELSPQIAKTNYDGKIVYAIKVLNSGNRDAISIRAELLMIEPQVVSGGIGKNILQFSLERDNWFLLHPSSKTSENFSVTFEFITCDDLIAEWETYENSYLIFQVYAQDVFSGFARVFSREYYSQNDVINGRFSKGTSMKICM